MDINNNNYTSAKIESWLDMLKDIARTTSSLKEASDKAKSICGRSYAEYSKKVDSGVNNKAKTEAKKEVKSADDDFTKNVTKLSNFDLINAINAINKFVSGGLSATEHSAASHKNNTVDSVASAKKNHGLLEFIREISVNRSRREVKVVFNDGRAAYAKCHPNDDFDLVVGISLCFSRWMFGDDFASKVRKTFGI